MSKNNGTGIWKEIDYSRHAVIEASAGTGKTYALEHIVLELILNHKFSINEILIVTFTEKAAGEIKDRVRKIIITELDAALNSNDTSTALLLKNAIDLFDGADISTIHGFCKKILSQYAFENGAALAQEIDNETYTTEAFNNVILSSEFSSQSGLEILKYYFDNKPIDDIAKRLKLIEQFKENALQNIVLADFSSLDDDDVNKIIETFYAKCKEIKIEIANTLGILDFDSQKKYTITKFYDLASGFSAHGNHLRNYLNNLKKYDQALSDILNTNIPLCFPPENNKFDFNFTQGKYLYTNSKTKDYQTLEEICPELYNIYVKIKSACKKLEELFEKNKKAFQKRLIDLILKERQRLKEEHQTMSFDDLIINFDNALQPDAPNSIALINALRGKYKIALIDEFQDTDALQWDVFSRIFTNYYENKYPANSFVETNNTLIVVGDPKQAIYKFRGADLNTYLLAKSVIAKKLNGQIKQLDTTYRCTNQMVQVYNTLFGGQWFDVEGTPPNFTPNKIEYTDVLSPTDNKKTCSWFPEDFSTVNLVDCNFKNFYSYIRGCASAIQQLLGKETDNGVCNYSDFCFLVRGTNDALRVASVLKQYKLPFIYQKDSSLYDSDEAMGIIIVLKFLLEPNNRKLRNAALLTDFFDAQPRDIQVLANISSLDLPCFQKWLEYLNANKWEKLFHSMLYDSGLYFRLCERMKDDVSAEIKLGIYNQLFEELLVATKEKQLSVYEFPAFLKGIRRQSLEEDSQNSLKKVTDDPRIQIMTMHASKGLEFKFVFYCAGFNKEPDKKKCTNHYSIAQELDSNDIVSVKSYYYDLNLIPDSELDKIIYDDKCEMRRLGYVAITRAQYMIFFPTGKPFLANEDGSEPLPLDYDKKGNPLSNYIGNALANLEGTNLIKVYSPNNQTQDQAQRIATRNSATIHEEMNRIIPIWDLPYLMRNKISLDSFSSINQHHKDAKNEISFDEDNEKENDEPENKEEIKEQEEKTPTLLPPGATFGKCFHEIMEQLAKGNSEADFYSIAKINIDRVYTDKKLDEIVKAAMQKYGIANLLRIDEKDKIIDSASNELKRMVWNTLNSPIPMLGGKTLGDIDTSDMKAELEFYINKNEYLSEQAQNNIMIGFIDLLFRIGNKYYILDWKTNLISSYDSITVNEAMIEANYTLQHEIYSIATIQWLEKLYGPTARKMLGGIVYLFVRGGANNFGDRPGCYEKAWSPDDFDTTCEKIKDEIKQAISHTQLNDY